MKNATAWTESRCERAGCGENGQGARKHLIFRRLSAFFTCFASFFTLFSRRKRFHYSKIRNIYALKRHASQNSTLNFKFSAFARASADRSAFSFKMRAAELPSSPDRPRPNAFGRDYEGFREHEKTFIFMWQICFRLVHSTARNRFGLAFESVKTPKHPLKL